MTTRLTDAVFDELCERGYVIMHNYFPEAHLNRAIVDPEAIAFSQRWLDTNRIHYCPGLGLCCAKS